MPIPEILTAMVTPFDEDGKIDMDEACRLANWLVEQGNDGILVAGTTGESPTLTHEEQIDLIAEVVKAVSVPVMAGAGSNCTKTAVEMTELATKAGAASILSVTPYYNRPSQAGLVGHFSAVAGATDLPVCLYDIPVRTGRKIETETILEMVHNVDNIVSVKDAAQDPQESARLVAEAPDDFYLYSGDDSLTLEFMKAGGIGCIGVATHWATPEYKDMIEAFKSGDAKRAEEMDELLAPSADFVSTDDAPNPVPVKVIMNEMGFRVGRGRPPLDVIPEGLRDKARELLAPLSGSAML